MSTATQRVFEPSPQQATALDFIPNGTGHGILVAVAGAGKTTTLVEMVKLIVRDGLGSGVFLAYNKKIADEIGAKLKAAGIDWKQFRAATFHSIGKSTWDYAVAGKDKSRYPKVIEKKVDGILEEWGVPEDRRSFIKTLVSLAKNHAVGVLNEGELLDVPTWLHLVEHYGLDERLPFEGEALERATTQAIILAQGVLQQSINMNAAVIDFDDMLYAPLIHEARPFRQDWVFVDEAQDTNPARRLFAERLLKPSGRLVAVGDPHQAIYGFAGADNDSLRIIAEHFQATELPLTITYRCPKQVVALARTWVSHIEAHESAPEGMVQHLTWEDFVKGVDAGALNPTDAILCRNTKPLVTLAFELIRKRIACHVEGKDIGKGLYALATKWKSVRRIGALRHKLDDYRDKEVKRLLEKEREAQADALNDRVDTLLVLMESLKEDDSVEEVQRIVDDLFRDTDGTERPTVTLSTVHKSKGREWDTVFLLGRNTLMPSPFAKQAWSLEQEKNLCYVAVTRAKSALIEVDL